VDTTQFILAIVTNIIAAIIIWLFVRLTRKAKTLLQIGTITANVRQTFTPKTITILGSLLIALFNLWIVLRIVFRDASFDRWQLLSAITLSLLAAYWVNKIIAVSRSSTELKLLAAEARISELEQREALNRDRHLSPEQKAKFLQLLSDKPKGRFDTMIGGATRETADFAQELVTALTEAGWSLYRRGTIIGPSGPRGLKLIVQNGENQRAIALQQALNLIGFSAAGEVNPKREPDSLEIYIGEK